MTLIVAYRRHFGAVIGADREIREGTISQSIAGCKIKTLGKYKLYGAAGSYNPFYRLVERFIKNEIGDDNFDEINRHDLEKKFVKLCEDYEATTGGRKNPPDLDMLIIDNRGDDQKHILRLKHQILTKPILKIYQYKSIEAAGIEKAVKTVKDYIHKQKKEPATINEAEQIVYEVITHVSQSVPGVDRGVDTWSIDEHNKRAPKPRRWRENKVAEPLSGYQSSSMASKDEYTIQVEGEKIKKEAKCIKLDMRKIELEKQLAELKLKENVLKIKRNPTT